MAIVSQIDAIPRSASIVSEGSPFLGTFVSQDSRLSHIDHFPFLRVEGSQGAALELSFTVISEAPDALVQKGNIPRSYLVLPPLTKTRRNTSHSKHS
jgi:hypothetical protein